MAQPTPPGPEAQKAAALEVFAQYEPPLYEAYMEMMVEWLAAVKAAMFAGGVVSLGLVPDPLKVFSQTPKWTILTAQYTEQVAREVLAAPYRNFFTGDVFESRPFVRNWIEGRENRLAAVPNEVYGLVSKIVDSATTNGASIPDITDQVEQLFGDTGMETWKNRARTVARTEVVGAYNGGSHDAFAMIAEADPTTPWVHRWLATEDHRTRPDHVEADGQVQPWGHPFTVGGFQMMHPHDPAAPAKEVVNCRCVELFEIDGDPTSMENRGYKKPGLTASLLQLACTDGQFCMQTHKPGLCKGQKRGQREPGAEQDATKRTPAQVAQVAVDGLQQAIAQAAAVAAQNATNPKMAAAARRAISGYKKALAPHQATLKQAAGENAKADKQGQRDAREQDSLEQRAAKKALTKKLMAERKAKRHHETLRKAAARIKARRAEQAKVAKMSKSQRTAYHKQKAAHAKAQREAKENQTLKDAAK
jgi:hypothetical protein